MSNYGSNAASAASDSPQAAWQSNSFLQSLQRQTPLSLEPVVGDGQFRISILDREDIVRARQSGRMLAEQLGCSGSRVALVMTAISELARNIIMHAGTGEILLTCSGKGLKKGIKVIAKDKGPGIADVSRLFERPNGGAGCSGLGLTGLRLVMDHFSIDSQPGAGTLVTCEVLAD